ncbi:MAG TPA: hypothetical protein VNY36_03335 [Bacteroidia bacterium]|jgi:hypothetical protein|nr:hypothetical protein [Bacteroidia bacterium]
MKFPTKTIKLKPGNTGLPVNSSRKEFLEDLPGRTKNTVRGVDLALINEAITAIADGHATINGKAPDTREKRFIVIATYFKTARTPLNMFFDGALNVQQNYTVAFKYKEQPVVVKFPEKLIEN